MTAKKQSFRPWRTWKADILNAYAEGQTDIEIRCLIIEKKKRDALSHHLWSRWLEEEEIFKEVVGMGRILGEAHLTKLGREAIVKDNINVRVWNLNMQNRFRMAEKQNTENEDSLEQIIKDNSVHYKE